MTERTCDERLLSFCARLLQTQSCSGAESAVARLLCEEALELGFTEARCDEYGNAICRLSGEGTGARKVILYDGHMDTVPVNPANWTREPFGGVVEDGRIYGRGASDMKCSLAAMLYAAARLLPEKGSLCGDIYISGTVNEEQFEGIAFAKVLESVKPNLVVIGEASEMALKLGQRGRAEILLEAFGKGAHSSNPQAGVNAVYTLMDYLALLRGQSPPHDDFLGDGISVLTDIVSKPFPGASVVPYYCAATLDRRLLCGEDRESVLGQYEALYRQLRENCPQAEMKISIARGSEETCTGAHIEGDRFFPAWRLETNDSLAEMGLAALQRAGVEPITSKYSFCTNGSMSAGEKGIPTLGFGPGRENLAHIDDEYVETAEIFAACRVFTELSRIFLEG